MLRLNFQVPALGLLVSVHVLHEHDCSVLKNYVFVGCSLWHLLGAVSLAVNTSCSIYARSIPLY